MATPSTSTTSTPTTQTVRGGDATAASGFVGRGAICNDFVCVSSPAVERTIRQFVSDVEKQKDGVNTQMFAEGVEYSDDAFMSFRGREVRYEQYYFIDWSHYISSG